MTGLAGPTDSPAAWAALEKLAKERSGLLAFDVGANIGQAARLLAPYFDEVHSYEPHPRSYQELAASAPANVKAQRLALSRRWGGCQLAEATEAMATGQLVTWAASPGHPEWGAYVGPVDVGCSTVDREVGVLGVLPAVVKIDTEGHEVEVLAGAKATISLAFTSWFIEVHDNALGAAVRRAFGPAKYALAVIEHEWLADERGEDHYWLVAVPRTLS